MGRSSIYVMKVSAFLLLKITEECHYRAAGAPAAVHNTSSGRRVCPATGHLVSSILISLAAGAPLQ